MAPMPSHDTPSIRLSPEARSTLLTLARESIDRGLAGQPAPQIEPETYPAALQERRACFVTLTRKGELRGCIGHLEAKQPLLLDVVENAWSAAFRDPRFPPLTVTEMKDLSIQISVLTPPVRLFFTSEQDLIEDIRPGIDGLILEEGRHRGTFLPSVWDSLPEPAAFLQHLKTKAGLPTDHWSDQIRIYRYETESFSAPEAD